jgi:hypothetical protein
LRSFCGFCVFEVFTSWDFGHEANPKSAKGHPDREVWVGKPHQPDDSAPVDKTIGLVAMTGSQKGNGGPERGRVPVSIA